MRQWYIRIPEDGEVHGPYDTKSDASNSLCKRSEPHSRDAPYEGLNAEIFSKGEPEVVVHKITHGYVNQRFEDGVCVKQAFVAGHPVEFEDEDGNPLEDSDAIESLPNLYHTFDMEKPK